MFVTKELNDSNGNIRKSKIIHKVMKKVFYLSNSLPVFYQIIQRGVINFNAILTAELKMKI